MIINKNNLQTEEELIEELLKPDLVGLDNFQLNFLIKYGRSKYKFLAIKELEIRGLKVETEKNKNLVYLKFLSKQTGGNK